MDFKPGSFLFAVVGIILGLGMFAMVMAASDYNSSRLYAEQPELGNVLIFPLGWDMVAFVPELRRFVCTDGIEFRVCSPSIASR
jgi:hypothetical protein